MVPMSAPQFTSDPRSLPSAIGAASTPVHGPAPVEFQDVELRLCPHTDALASLVGPISNGNEQPAAYDAGAQKAQVRCGLGCCLGDSLCHASHHRCELHYCFKTGSFLLNSGFKGPCSALHQALLVHVMNWMSSMQVSQACMGLACAGTGDWSAQPTFAAPSSQPAPSTEWSSRELAAAAAAAAAKHTNTVRSASRSGLQAC